MVPPIADSAFFLLFLGQTVVVCNAFFMNRMSVTDFRESSGLSQQQVLDQPVVLGNALEWRDCQSWWNHIATRSGQEDVKVDRREGTRHMALHTATQLVRKESSHSDPIRVSSPGSSCSTDQLPFYDLLESLFDLEDFTPLFSWHIPISDTLVIAGEGASCQLQRHPYTTYCLGLAGSSLWRLLPPEQAFPSESILLQAWEGFHLSIGDQVSRQLGGELFALRHKDVLGNDDDSEDETIAFMDDDKFAYFQHLAETDHLLRPSLAVDEEWTSTVLLDGDLLVIPPNWWYQNYNLEMSISLESQRCHNLSEFVRHIVEKAMIFVPPRILQRTEFHTRKDAKESIDELFQLLEEQARYSQQSAGDSLD